MGIVLENLTVRLLTAFSCSLTEAGSTLQVTFLTFCLHLLYVCIYTCLNLHLKQPTSSVWLPGKGYKLVLNNKQRKQQQNRNQSYSFPKHFRGSQNIFYHYCNAEGKEASPFVRSHHGCVEQRV